MRIFHLFCCAPEGQSLTLWFCATRPVPYIPAWRAGSENKEAVPKGPACFSKGLMPLAGQEDKIKQARSSKGHDPLPEAADKKGRTDTEGTRPAGTKIAYTRSFIIKGRFSTSFIDIPNWKAISRKAFLITALGTPAPISRIICPRRIGATQPTRDPFPFPIR